MNCDSSRLPRRDRLPVSIPVDGPRNIGFVKGGSCAGTWRTDAKPEGKAGPTAGHPNFSFNHLGIHRDAFFGILSRIPKAEIRAGRGPLLRNGQMAEKPRKWQYRPPNLLHGREAGRGCCACCETIQVYAAGGVPAGDGEACCRSTGPRNC